MVTTGETAHPALGGPRRTMRGWAWLLTGGLLVIISIALHVLAAASVSGTDPLTADVATIARQGWVRLVAWAALSGGAFLVVAGWSQRTRARSRGVGPGSAGTEVIPVAA